MNYLPLEVSYSLTRESFFILGGPYSESGCCWGGQASKVGCYVFSRPLMVGPRTSMRFCCPVIFYSCTHVELLTTTMHQAAPSLYCHRPYASWVFCASAWLLWVGTAKDLAHREGGCLPRVTQGIRAAHVTRGGFGVRQLAVHA